jgi:hypothetical protein
MSSSASQRADRLARVGLLGTYTMLARRAARPELQPAGRAGAACALDAASFGFRVRLPAGWVRQTVETLHVPGRGVILLQDLDVLTPVGVRVHVGSAVEPADPEPGALEELVRVVGDQMPGQLVACEGAADGAPVRDLTIFGERGALFVARVAIVARRVLCADAWVDGADAAAGDDVVRELLETLVVTAPRTSPSEPPEGRPSGTYRAIR